MKRIIIWTIAILVTLMIILPATAWFMLKRTDLKEWVSNRVAKATGIQVTITDYELGFPATIRIRGLSVQAPTGVSVTADTVVARPSLMKLITGSLYLNAVTVDGASVTVPLGLPAPEPEAAAARPDRTGAEPRAVPLGLLRITDASVHLTGPEKTTDITGVTIEVQPGRRASVVLSPGHPDNRLTLHVDLTPANGLKNLEAELSIHHVRSLLDLAGAQAPPIGDVTGTVTVQATPESDGFRVTGSMDIPTLALDMGGEPVLYPVSGDFQARAAADGSRVTLDKATVTIRDTSIRLAGPIRPELKLALDGKQMDVQSLVRLIPPSETPFPPDFQFQGVASLSGTVTGETLNAELSLQDVQLAIPDVQPVRISGGVNLSLDRIRIPGLLITGPWADLQITGDVRDYLSDHGTTRIELTGKHLDLTRLAPAPGTDNTAAPSPPSPAPTGKPVPIAYPDFEGMTHTITGKLGSLLLPGISIQDLVLNLTAGDKAIRLSRCDGKLLDGTVQLTAGMTPAADGVRVTTTGRVKQVRLKGLLSDKLPVTGGRLTGQFNLDATGADTRAMKQHANGKLSFHVTEAMLRDTPAIRKVEGITNLQLVGRKVDQFTGSGSITDGLVTLSDTRLRSKGIEMELAGTVSLMGDLDLKLPVRIDEKTASVLPGTLQYLKEDGVVTLPLTITGTVRSPKVRPDTAAVAKAAGKKLKKKMKDKLLKGLFGN